MMTTLTITNSTTWITYQETSSLIWLNNCLVDNQLHENITLQNDV
jgi:hypothetical protein